MPRKPFDFMVVKLTKDYGKDTLKKGDICIVSPYNWYGNTNGWDKDHPEAAIFEAKEKEEYSRTLTRMNDPRTYWRQERGYVLHTSDGSFSTIVSWSDNHWDILNVDGEDQTKADFPVEALEIAKMCITA